MSDGQDNNTTENQANAAAVVDGAVVGTSAADDMQPGYTDADGDQIDGTDGVDDTILALGGDDTVDAGDGNDTVYGGSGADAIDGGDGDDTLYGDSSGLGAGGTGREALKWSEAPDPDGGGPIDDGDDLTGGFTMNTGTVNVTFNVLSQTAGGLTEFADNEQYTDGVEAASDSSLFSDHDLSDGASEYELLFDRGIENVEFRINDIDNDSNVSIFAFDANGDAVEVSLTGGSSLTLVDSDGINGIDTAETQGGNGLDTSEAYSLLVEIEGPVSRLVIQHSQDGNTDSGVNITDIYFDAPLADDGPGAGDTIDGGDGDDVIFGEDGADVITGGNGGDTVEGGDGNDLIDTGADIALPDLGFPGYETTPPIPADPLPDNDRDFVDGGDGNDIISTGDDADTVYGGTGDDTIKSGIDADEVYAGEGDDLVIGSEGNDTVFGGDGDDTIYGGTDPNLPDELNIENGPGGDPEEDNGRDLIFAGDGNDVVYGQDDDDTIFGGAGQDILDGGIDEDSIDGGADSDLISGGQGDDDVSGGLSDDLVLGEAGDDVVAGDEGNDLLGGGAGSDTVDGGAGIDVVVGGEDSDTLFGGTETDLISGGDGADLIYGGDESDTPDGGNDILSGDDGDDTVIGGTGNDLILGGEGADDLSGGADRDTFLEITAGDVIDGGEEGEDYDTIIVTEPAIVDYEDGNPEAGTITFFDGVTGEITGTATFQNIENVILQPFDEGVVPVATAFGAPTGDTPDVSQAVLSVLGGSDVPPYTPGDGIVDGTDGDDDIDLGYVDVDGDEIDAGDAILPGEGPDDDIVLAGEGNDTVDGNLADDEIYGEDGDDVISGNDGEDEILGGDGDDDLSGDSGNDVISGGEGNDTIDGGTGSDLLGGGIGADSVSGGDGTDIILGDEGDDTLEGGEGSDLISAGTGNDAIDLGSDDDVDFGFGGDDRDTFTGIGQNDRVDGGEGGDDFDTLDLTGAAETANAGGSLTVDFFNNPEDGVVTFFDANGDATGTMEFYNIEDVVICFTPGTLIATPQGERKVESLREGDRVITRDNGIQEIRWIGHRQLTGAELARARHLRPIRIRAGALGNGLPERDMVLSPNHRVLVANDKTALYFDEREVLVSSKHLTGLEGVDEVDVNMVTYIHFMFDQHEVVLSDGSWTESFQPGDYSLDGLGNAQRTEIFELFPELKTAEGLKDYQAARRSLKKHEARALFQ